MGRDDIALLLSGLMFVFVVVEKIFGGGNGLANRFHKLKEDTTKDIADLRRDLVQRVDEYEDMYKVGLDAITSNIHALQLAALEFRAKMAEEYVRQGGLEHIEKRMSDGFEKVERRMGELQDMIVWAQPQQSQAIPPPRPGTPRSGNR